jgi:hypothetical protein
VGLIALVLSAPTLRAWYEGALALDSVLTRCLIATIGAWVAVALIARLLNGYSTGRRPARSQDASHAPASGKAFEKNDAPAVASDADSAPSDAEALQGAVAVG